MRMFRAVLEGLRLALTRESLGDSPADERPPKAGGPRGVLHVLFVSREPLGLDPEPPPSARKPLLRALFGIEELPYDPVPPLTRRRGRFSGLFALEKLDDDSP